MDKMDKMDKQPWTSRNGRAAMDKRQWTMCIKIASIVLVHGG